MASTVVQESIIAKVEEVSKRGKEGTYKVKVVKFNNKEYSVSKDDKDSVKVGQEYEFKLTKSEYNDKLYYWANLIETGKKESGESQSSPTFTSKDFFDYWDNLPMDNQKKAFKYFFENNKFIK